MNLTGRTAVITGGGRGVGAAAAYALAEARATVAFAARNEEQVVDVAAQLRQRGYEAFAFRCDVTDHHQVRDLALSASETMGKVDILINNAGLTRDNLLMRMKDEEFDEVIATNLKGAFNFTRAVTRSMMKKRDGVILNITSVVGLIGNAGQTNYAASKAGMIGMTKSVAKELGSRGVRCNALAPGFIRTDMTAELSEDQIESLQSLIPLGRLGETDDISGVVRFLVSPAARYITGQVVAVDGGMAI